jgi:flagellar biosynthesis protein FlhF
MRLKSYFSGTVEAAMDLARRELGEDALLVNARPSTPETRSLGAFEVVFGLPEGAREMDAPPPRALSPDTGFPAGPQDRLAREVAEVKRQIERIDQFLRFPRPLPAAGSQESELYARLVEAELEPALARQVAEGTAIEELFATDATLGCRGAVESSSAGRAVVALIGPPGAGKTTTLIKLAATHGLASRRPAQILSIDVCRIAAADQLRSLAAILGIGCEIVETPGALAQAIEEHRNKDYIFIDTPGYASAEMAETGDARGLAALFASHPEIDTHLVLVASMKPLDLARTVDRYQMFSPHKLIFTRLDETESFGALINESARRSLPISFLSAGQAIPDDLEPASKERLAARVLGRAPRGRGAAA